MSEIFDVIIIGGGINGTGVARDCALRGLKTLLIEKKDLCGGTSGSSSGMIHGGLRYLLYDVKTTKISSKDSGYIQKIAPFLLFRIPFLFLIHEKEGPNVELLETFFEIYDRYSKLKNAKLHTRLNQEEVHRLEPGLASDITGAITFDEWGVDPYRLCLLNAKDAVRLGGKVLLHTEVVDLLFDQENLSSRGQSHLWRRPRDLDGDSSRLACSGMTGDKKRVSGVRVRAPNREYKDYFGKVVLNISGPWISKICKMAGIDLRLRPGKGIHIVFDRRISNIAFMTQTIDRRNVFLLPYENTSIIGTTDDDFYGDPDHLEVTEDEVEYLFQAIERIFPDIRKYRVISTYAGIRPTLYEWGKLEDELSREHKIFDHGREGVDGFLTMAGGKLASYRLMSEELTDVVCKKLNLRKKCETHLKPLPGGEDLIPAEELKAMAARAEIPLYALSRLYFRHGGGIRDILFLIQEHPSYRRVICAAEPVLEAEIRYVISKEWAESLDDIGRRTRLGWGGCQGGDCVWPAALILKEMLGKDPVKEASLFLQKRWKSLIPCFEGDAVAEEELKFQWMHLSPISQRFQR